MANKEFAVPLFGIGDMGACLFSFIFPPCALAQSRTQMDGSSCCFNLLAGNPISTRWLIRNAYAIEGSDCDDLLSAWLCPCCSINQLYQTTKAYGAPAPDAGRQHNVGAFSAQASNENCCRNCMYSLCCCPCAIGTSMQNAIDMPFWMGCCCVSMCQARNIVRYQYRIAGDDCCDDYCLPTMVGCLTYLLSMCPCLVPLTLPYFLNILMKMLSETETRSINGGWTKRFLASGPQTATSSVGVVVVQQQMPQVIVAPQPIK